MGAILAIISALGFIPAMAALARFAGDNVKNAPSFVGLFPEIAFALCIAFAAGAMHGFNAFTFPLYALVAWFGMETGHGNAYHMGAARYTFPIRRQTLDAVVLPLCRLLKSIFRNIDVESRSPLYCWLFMGTKGLIIGAPLFPFGLVLGILWPLAYWICFVKLRKPETPVAEWLSGAFAGAVVSGAILSSLL